MSAQRILEQSGLDWQSVRRQYDVRAGISRRLIRLINANLSSEFARLALGITDPDGNYSARERSLGPRILAENQNAAERVMRLARAFSSLQDGEEVVDELRRAGIINLGIAVGSELACLITPQSAELQIVGPSGRTFCSETRVTINRRTRLSGFRRSRAGRTSTAKRGGPLSAWQMPDGY